MKAKSKAEVPEVLARWEPGGVFGDGLAVTDCPFCGGEHIHQADERHAIAKCPPGTPAYDSGYVIRMDPTTMPDDDMRSEAFTTWLRYQVGREAGVRPRRP